MFASLASLLQEAIWLMLRSFEIVLPQPLQQMAPTLAQARSFRKVTVDTHAMDAQVRLSRSELVAVRNGMDIDTHMSWRMNTGGQSAYLETITTEAGWFRRQDRHEAWARSERPNAQPNALLVRSLEGLANDVQWTALGDEQIQGKACMAYQVIRGTEDGMWEQVLFWVAQESVRPVEMLALSLQRGRLADRVNLQEGESLSREDVARLMPRPQMLTSQVVTWSTWDDPTLTIPTI